jgi:hypothetical protein
MARARSHTKADGKMIDQYEHLGKTRKNNPPVGFVTPKTDPDDGQKTYAYDPHVDPQLVWAGKAEHMSFEVATVSLHVHERIDPLTIIEAVRRVPETDQSAQPSLFEQPGGTPPLRQAIDFYRGARDDALKARAARPGCSVGAPRSDSAYCPAVLVCWRAYPPATLRA